MSRRQLPPAPGDDLAATLRARHHSDQRPAQPAGPPTARPHIDDAPESPPTAPTRAGAASARRPREQRPPMVRRSWYLPASTADSLAELVDDLHHQTRIPRHLVWTAISDQLTDHRAQLLDRLRPPE